MNSGETPSLVLYKEPSGNYSALYKDGELMAGGRCQEAEKALLKHFQVEVVHSSSFLLGGHSDGHIAKTLEEAEGFHEAQELVSILKAGARAEILLTKTVRVWQTLAQLEAYRRKEGKVAFKNLSFTGALLLQDGEVKTYPQEKVLFHALRLA